MFSSGCPRKLGLLLRGRQSRRLRAPKRRGLPQVRCRTMSVASQRPAPTPGAEAPETGRRPSLARSFLREARPKQWVKNLLVFAAPGAAGVLTEPVQVGRTLIAFAAFCLAASGTYFLNDAMDAQADRQHPKKRYRPVAAGLISTAQAKVTAVVLIVLALAISAPLNGGRLVVVVAAYVMVTVGSTWWVMHEPALDLGCVASGVFSQAIAGAYADVVASANQFLELC